MKVSEVSISQVFLPTRTLKIPYFQRSYVWEEANWEKFFNDIAEIALAQKNGEGFETYFMGSIILSENNGDDGLQFDVIDGQQRLTTIVLFMKALFLSLGRDDLFRQAFMQQTLLNDEKPILISNYNDRLTYNNILSLEISKAEVIDDSKIAAGFAYFVNRINASRNGEDKEFPVSPQDLYSAVQRYVKLVCIEVGKDENAQKIFETINCTGVRLTTGEMLKNYLFNETQVQLYEHTWRKCFEGKDLDFWSSILTKGRLEGTHIEEFFYRYMLIKMQEPEISDKLTPSERKRYRKQGGLFVKFRDLIEKHGLEKEGMIQDIISTAGMYKQTFGNDEPLQYAIPRFAGLERLVCFMYAQDSWTMTPYILYILKTQRDMNEQQKLFGYMETYLIRRTFCKCSNNNYSDLFSENLIGNGINTYEGFKNYVTGAARGSLMMPSDDDVIEAIHSKDLKKNAKVLLYMLESKLNDEFTGELAAQNGFVSLEKVEAIIPEKENDGWFTSKCTDEERGRLPKTIGNYVLLRGKLKSAQKKAAWKEKREIMKQINKGIRTSAVISNLQEPFTEETVKLRNKKLAELVVKTWPL